MGENFFIEIVTARERMEEEGLIARGHSYN